MAGPDVLVRVTGVVNDDRDTITYTVQLRLDGNDAITESVYEHEVEEGVGPEFTLESDLITSGYEFDPPLIPPE